MKNGIANNHYYFLRLAWAICAMLLLTACGSTTLALREDFPQPLVERLPYDVGVHYSPDFSSFAYAEEDIVVSLGVEQRRLFDLVFSSMFTTKSLVENPDSQAPQPGLDLVLVPVLEDFAFLTPGETATNFYSVSLKYHIRVYDENTRLVGYWPFVAFGKNRGALVSKKEPLSDATNMALRDVAAALVSEFHSAVLKEEWRPPEAVARETE